ncbi:hypothetical protein DOY81_005797 [Sarcophaga bullata]|nr:hypothetical protein DOY81_005797 [Sarcophaga bullata]
MLSKTTKKISVFLLLVILVNTASGASTSIPNTTEEIDRSTTISTETTAEPVTTTQSPSVTESDIESTTETATEKIECVCDCVGNDGNQVKLDCTTQSPEESQTEPSSNTENGTATPEEVTTENSNNEETTPTSNTENDDTIQTTTALPEDVTTVNSNEEDTTTVSNAENDDTAQDTTALPEEVTTENSNNKDTTTASNTESGDNTTNAPETTTTEADSTAATTTTTPAPIACTTPGQRQPHELDCHQYYECSSESSVDGSFHLLAKSCPEKQAFNVGLNRCSRDISDCTLPIQCSLKSSIADPASNSSYYLCVPRLIGVGFRVFHIDCSSNELYYPLLGKCFIDLNNLPTQSFPPPIWNQIRDYDIVKAELKLLKEQDKLILKEQKAQQKAEEKLQKELEKEAKKRAKEEEKANKEKVKQEAATFACSVEGNYPSAVSESTYIACVNKKGKLKALAMQCAYGATFDAQSAVCVNNPAVVNSSVSKEEHDDDEDD